jgi:hypothetical protein
MAGHAEQLLQAIGMPARGWHGPVSKGLLRLLELGSGEALTFQQSTDLIRLAEPDLWHRITDSVIEENVEPLRRGFPLACCFNDLAAHRAPSPFAILLLQLALELRMRDPADRSPLELAPIIRGVLTGRAVESQRLLLTLGNVGTLHELALEMSVLAAVDAGKPFHQGFRELWNSRLRDTIAALVLEAGVRIARARALRPTGWTPSATDSVALDVDLGGDGEPVAVEAITIPARLGPRGAPSPRTQLADAKVTSFHRKANFDLLMTPDGLLPAARGRRIVDATGAAFDRAFDRLDAVDCERLLALLVCQATGTSATELLSTDFGNGPDPERFVIDLDRAVFWRPEGRPPSAAGAPGGDCWRDIGGPIALLLPLALVDRARKLLRLWTAAPGRLITSGLDDEIGLHHLVRSVAPDDGVGWTCFRLRIASGLARRLGTEAAQVAYCDTFGVSAGPAYYGTFQAKVIAATAWSVVAPLFGETTHPALEAEGLPFHSVGSRIAPSATGLAHWASTLATGRRRLAQFRGSDAFAELENSRDQLAAALLLGAAHRPHESLALVSLYDLVPELSVCIFRDKPADPRHLTRVAALSPRILATLRRHLDVLVRLARNRAPAVSTWAQRVLRGDGPLLDIIDSGGGIHALDVPALVEWLGGDLARIANTNRHGLNQHLLDADVDPEDRHQHLGWQVSEATALADCSPRSAADFSSGIAAAIDDYLGKHALFPVSTAGFVWDDVPLPALRRWDEALRQHTSDTAAANAALRLALRERRSEALAQVREPLYRTLETVLPALKVARKGLKHPTLVRAIESEDSIAVSAEHVLAIEALVLEPGATPLDAYVVRSEIARLFRAAGHARITSGHVPAVQKLGTSQVSSPFLPGSGLAVRQMMRAREVVESGRGLSGASPEDLAFARAFLAILCCSPHRHADRTMELLEGASQACISPSQPALLRIPLPGHRHTVLTGIAAVLVGEWRKSAQAGVPSRHRLSTLLMRALSDLCGDGVDGDEFLVRLEQTAQVAGRLELSGIERTVMLGMATPRTVSLERVMQHVEDRPAARSLPEATHEECDPARADAEPSAREATRTWKKVAPWFRMWDRKYKKTLKLSGVSMADRRRGRRTALEREISLAVATLGDDDRPAALALRYAHHLATQGGTRKRRLALGAIRTMLGRFARPLIEAGAELHFAQAGPQQIEHLYSVVLAARSTKVRRRVLEDLRGFHRFAARIVAMATIDWSELQDFAGARHDGDDPGVLRDAEVDAVWDQLLQDRTSVEQKEAVDPRERHVCGLRLIGFALGEASGCRRSTVHGLTFRDLELQTGADFIVVRTTGDYGAAKTQASVGFIPLEGSSWARVRSHVIDWVKAQMERMGPNFDPEFPLFGELRDPRTRVDEQEVFGRTGQLLRWATGEGDARYHWLRKRRITQRFGGLWIRRQLPRARDVYRVLSRSGHVSVITPLGSYLADAASLSPRHVHQECEVARKTLLDISGAKPVTFDQRIQRYKTSVEEDARPIGWSLGLSLKAQAVLPGPTLTGIPALPAPVLDAGIESGFRLADLDTYLRARQQFPPSLSAVRIGARAGDVHPLELAMRQFAERTGIALTEDATLAGVRLLSPPLGFVSARAILTLLSLAPPDPRVLEVATDWAGSAKLADVDSGLSFHVAAERQRAKELLQSLGIAFREMSYRSTWLIKPLRRPDDATPPNRAGEGLSRQLAWVLAIHWLWQRTHSAT